MAYPDARAAVASLAEHSATLADLREIVTRFPELRAVVAAYPSTDAAMLAWLRDLHDPAVDAQLAKRASAGPAPVAAEVPAMPEPTPPEPMPSEPTPPAAVPPLSYPPADYEGLYRPAAPEPVSYPPITYGPATSPSVPLAPEWVPAPAQGPAQASAAGPAYPAVPGPTPPRESEAPRRRSALPLVLAIVAALVLVGGVGAAFAFGLFGGKASAPAAATQPRETAKPSPPVSGSPSAATSASPSGSATPAVTGVTCWDGTEAVAVSGCEPPSGKNASWQYLEYVYPSIAGHSECVKADSTGKSTYTGITLMWECELGDALVRYRYWENAQDARTHYAKKFNAKTVQKTYDLLVGGEAVHGWAKTDKDTVAGPGGIKRVLVTVFLPDQNLSFTVEGNTSKSMWAAFDQVRVRPLEQSLGSPAGSPIEEAPLTAKPR